jgi:hypothetical protein
MPLAYPLKVLIQNLGSIPSRPEFTEKKSLHTGVRDGIGEAARGRSRERHQDEVVAPSDERTENRISFSNSSLLHDANPFSYTTS